MVHTCYDIHMRSSLGWHVFFSLLNSRIWYLVLKYFIRNQIDTIWTLSKVRWYYLHYYSRWYHLTSVRLIKGQVLSLRSEKGEKNSWTHYTLWGPHINISNLVIVLGKILERIKKHVLIKARSHVYILICAIHVQTIRTPRYS